MCESGFRLLVGNVCLCIWVCGAGGVGMEGV